MTAPQDAYAQAGRDIAYRIRAELVCCNIYDKDAGTPRSGGRAHSVCFWGEASARLAEDVAATGIGGEGVSSGAFAAVVDDVEARGFRRAITLLRAAHTQARENARDPSGRIDYDSYDQSFEIAADLLEEGTS